MVGGWCELHYDLYNSSSSEWSLLTSYCYILHEEIQRGHFFAAHNHVQHFFTSFLQLRQTLFMPCSTVHVNQ